MTDGPFLCVMRFEMPKEAKGTWGGLPRCGGGLQAWLGW